MERDRKRYSTLAKSIVIGLQMIASVMLAVSVVLLSTCVNQNMLNMGDLRNSSFIETGYFERTFSKQVNQLLEYLQLKEQFETDGVFDENRPEVLAANSETVEEYKKYYNKYEQNATNLYYWLGKTGSDSCITNMDENMTEEEAYERGLSLGRYIWFDTETFFF